MAKKRKIKVSIRPERRTALAASTESTRYAIGYVNWTPGEDGEGFLTATDGKSMSISKVKGSGPSALIPAEMGPSRKKDIRDAELSLNSDWRNTADKTYCLPALEECRYPDTASCWPEVGEDWQAVSFDAKILGRIVASLDTEHVTLLVPPDRAKAMVIVPRGDEDDDGNPSRAAGVLMPIKYLGDSRSIVNQLRAEYVKASGGEEEA